MFFAGAPRSSKIVNQGPPSIHGPLNKIAVESVLAFWPHANGTMCVREFHSRWTRNSQKLEGLKEPDRPMALVLDCDSLTAVGGCHIGDGRYDLVSRKIPFVSMAIRGCLPASRLLAVGEKQGEAKSATEAEVLVARARIGGGVARHWIHL